MLSFSMEPFLYHQRAIQKLAEENNDLNSQREIEIIQLKSEIEIYKEQKNIEFDFDMEEIIVPDELENFEEERS